MTSAENILYSRTKDAVSIFPICTSPGSIIACRKSRGEVNMIFSCDYYICVDIVSPHMWVVSVIDQSQRSLMATQFSWYKNGGHFRFAQNMRFRTEFLGVETRNGFSMFKPSSVPNLGLVSTWDTPETLVHCSNVDDIRLSARHVTLKALKYFRINHKSVNVCSQIKQI